MPASVYGLVMEQNLRQVEQRHLLDPAYFKCAPSPRSPPITQCAQCAVNSCDSASHPSSKCAASVSIQNNCPRFQKEV